MLMNLYILFFVSLPEAFLNLIIFLLFAGTKSNLKVNRSNVIRFTISLIAMLVATSIIRPLAQNVVENVIAHCIAYIIIISLLYKLRLWHSAISVVFTMLLFSTIENSYYPFIIAYISGGIDNFTKHYQLFVLYSVPNRILQVMIIFFLYKYEILLVTKISRQFHYTFVISTFILVFVEYFFGFIFYSYFNVFSLLQQITYAVALVLMVVFFNYLMFMTIYVTIGKIITNGFSQYQELEYDAKSAFLLINSLIKSNRVDEAAKLIDDLNRCE